MRLPFRGGSIRWKWKPSFDVFKKMKTSAKLWSAFLVLIMTSTVVAAFAMLRINQLSQTVTEIAQVQHEKVVLANEWKALTSANALRFTSTAVTANAGLAEMFKKDVANTATREAEVIAALKKFTMVEEEKQLFDEVLRIRQEMGEVEKLMRQLAAEEKLSDVFGIYDFQYQPQISQLRFNMDEFAAYQNKVKNTKVQQADRAQAMANIAALIMLIALPCFGGVCAWLITRSIQRPLTEAVNVANAVAAGDLTRDIHTDRHDEFGDMMRAIQHMVESLSTVVGEVQSVSETVTTASKEVANGNADLSARTERQASNLEQTAASVEQLTATVQHNSESADKARQLSQSASEVAERGGEMATQVVTTMSTISTSSKRIGEITGVIDGIAFQTNILALNAAVEAARAGDHGRGFAVVASEVRALAHRSAEAAKEIKQLIAESVSQVEDGRALVDAAGQTMQQIVTSVKQVAALVHEISTATHEQANGIGEINQAVSLLDEMTQQNAALVEQSAAASESLREQAHRLENAISVFKLAN